MDEGAQRRQLSAEESLIRFASTIRRPKLSGTTAVVQSGRSQKNDHRWLALARRQRPTVAEYRIWHQTGGETVPPRSGCVQSCFTDCSGRSVHTGLHGSSQWTLAEADDQGFNHDLSSQAIGCQWTDNVQGALEAAGAADAASILRLLAFRGLALSLPTF